MAIKKKGTPEKIEVVADVSELEKFRKLIEKSINPDTIVKKSKQKKSK